MIATINKPKSFTVNDSNGHLLPGIKNAFLAHSLIDLESPPATIRSSNGTIYQAVYDSIVVPTKAETSIIKVLVSFQQHEDGNFAIIRTLNSTKQKE